MVVMDAPRISLLSFGTIQGAFRRQIMSSLTVQGETGGHVGPFGPHRRRRGRGIGVGKGGDLK